MTGWLGGTATRLYAPQDLRTDDPRPHAPSFDVWAAEYLTGKLEQRFGPGSEIAQMLGLASAPVVSSYDPFSHAHMFTCTVCGKQRRGTAGVCQYCRSVETRGRVHRQGVTR